MQVMPWVLMGVIIVLSIALWSACQRLARSRRKLRQEGLGRAWKIPMRPLATLDAVFIPDGRLGPTPRSEVSFTAIGANHVAGVTSDYEAWILSVLSRTAQRLFEFGTCTGRTTYLWARNSPPGAVIHTITLGPQDVDTYRTDRGDDERDREHAMGESTFERFAYTGTEVAHKVVQHFGDSKRFDDAPFAGVFDVIFVDGSHASSYVKSDSDKALRMLKPGGVILWHDYRGPRRSGGVYSVLNDLDGRLPLFQIEGTSLVVYRSAQPSGQ